MYGGCMPPSGAGVEVGMMYFKQLKIGFFNAEEHMALLSSNAAPLHSPTP
jgi:hypothetical protein